MNLHVLADRVTATVGGLYLGADRFFSRSIASPSIAEVVQATRVSCLEPAGPGGYPATADTPAGALDCGFWVARWLGAAYPTLLYCHGSGERPFDFARRAKNSFRALVLDAAPPWPGNLIALRAPFHAGSQRAYARAMGELINFTSMLGALVALSERLIVLLRARGARAVALCGISLGGWATNLHAALYGSADVYVPLLAGTALDDLFLNSSYPQLVADSALARPEVLRRVLSFEEAFCRAPRERVFPLLARHDQFIRWPRQAESYGGLAVALIDRGHVTAAASPSLLRDHLRRHLQL